MFLPFLFLVIILKALFLSWAIVLIALAEMTYGLRLNVPYVRNFSLAEGKKLNYVGKVGTGFVFFLEAYYR